MIPFVSIVLTNYNLSEYLLSSVNSLLNQDFQGKLEIILIDDCSTDNSRQIINTISDERVIKIFNNENIGARKSIEYGFSIAHGDFICRFDADDRWAPSFVSSCISIFDRFPDISLVYTDVFFLDYNSKISGDHTLNLSRPNKDEGTIENELFCILENYYICAPGIMAKREVWQSALPIPETLIAVDWYLSCSILKTHKAYFLNRKLAYYRVHEKNMHVSVVHSGHEIEIFEVIFNNFIKDNPSFSRRQKRYLTAVNLFNIGLKYYGLKRYNQALKYYFQSITLFNKVHIKSKFIIFFLKGIIKALLNFNKPDGHIT